MSATISTLSVRLTASASAFSATMASAGKSLSSLGSSVASIGGTVVGFGGALAAIAGAGSLAVLTKDALEHIDATTKLADRLGATTEGLVGLQYSARLAGLSNEELQTGLQKMQKALGGAAEDGSATDQVFKSLALSAMQLANMPADEAFKAIAESISKVHNPVERANAELKLFGRSGQQLDGLLRQGAAGIAAAQEEAKKLGLTFDHVDGSKIRQANEAIVRMESVFEGVTNQIAIGLAPYIQAAADKFTELATAGGGLGPKVGPAIEWVATAVATATDYINLVPAAFHGFRAGALEAIAGVLGAIDWLGSGLVKLLNLIPGVNIAWTDSLSTLKQGMEEVAGEEAQKMNDALGKFSRGDNAAKVAKVFDDIKAKSEASATATAANAEKMRGAFTNIEGGADNLKKVADTLDSLQKDVDQFGLNDAQKRLSGLKSQGASQEQLAQASSLVALKAQFDAIAKISTDDPLTDFASKMEQLQQLYAQGKVTADQFAQIRDEAKSTLTDKLTDSAKQITADVKTPLEKYQEEVAKLNDLFSRGLITQTTLDRATIKAKTSLETSGEKAQPAAVAAVRAGSAEAMKIAFESSRGVNVMAKDQVAKQQLKEQQTSNQYLEQIARSTRDTSAGSDLPEVDI